MSSLLQGCVVLECTDNCKRHHAATPIKTNSSALSLTTTAVGVWHDRAGVQRGPGVPYSQIRILARARWQLFHLRGILSRGGLKPHVVLAGDNALLEDAEEADPQIPSSGIAGNSRDKVCTPTDVSGRRGRIHARRFNAILDVLCQN